MARSCVAVPGFLLEKDYSPQKAQRHEEKQCSSFLCVLCVTEGYPLGLRGEKNLTCFFVGLFKRSGTGGNGDIRIQDNDAHQDRISIPKKIINHKGTETRRKTMQFFSLCPSCFRVEFF